MPAPAVYIESESASGQVTVRGAGVKELAKGAKVKSERTVADGAEDERTFKREPDYDDHAPPEPELLFGEQASIPHQSKF